MPAQCLHFRSTGVLIAISFKNQRHEIIYYSVDILMTLVPWSGEVLVIGMLDDFAFLFSLRARSLQALARALALQLSAAGCAGGG